MITCTNIYYCCVLYRAMILASKATISIGDCNAIEVGFQEKQSLQRCSSTRSIAILLVFLCTLQNVTLRWWRNERRQHLMNFTEKSDTNWMLTTHYTLQQQRFNCVLLVLCWFYVNCLNCVTVSHYADRRNRGSCLRWTSKYNIALYTEYKKLVLTDTASYTSVQYTMLAGSAEFWVISGLYIGGIYLYTTP